ncbi:hypothetical protein SDC9_88235 [bioreactor metagenome]|uniref:Uncharacterized protein n=1 Tax=bioreactor metagenome TaxID=1076179 RepID=A0A644ZL14_9ZZZZ
MEVVTEGKKITLFHVLEVVSPHCTFAAAHAIPLDRLEQDDSWSSLVL